MKFYKYLYVGENVKSPAKIKLKLKVHAFCNVTLLTWGQGSNQLDIIQSYYFKQKYYRHHPPVIIGIASDYDEAIEILSEIAKECYLATKTCNLKEYLIWKATQ